MTVVTINGAAFDAASHPEVAAYNMTVLDAMRSVGWRFPPESAAALRDSLAAGAASAGLYLSDRAETIRVPAPGGGVDVRVLRAGEPAAIYVHCHSGGWTIGSAAAQDQRLEQIVEATGMTVVSVEYRLAPEHQYPAGLDDCEVVIRWLLAEAGARFGAERVLVGGESAGANLALSAALRVQRTDPGRISALSLAYGSYDLSGTPSQRMAGDDVLLPPRALAWFYDQYVPAGLSRRHPEISPVYADLRGLPPILVSAGALDSLVDDSLFLATRLVVSGVDVQLQVVPGADHGFDTAPYGQARAAVKVIDEFLARYAHGGETR